MYEKDRDNFLRGQVVGGITPIKEMIRGSFPKEFALKMLNPLNTLVKINKRKME